MSPPPLIKLTIKTNIMKYKLIKLLPFENSPRIGYTSEPHLSQKDEDHYWNGLWFNPENYPEFWEEVVEKDYEILSLKSIHSTIVIDYKNGGGAYIKGTFEAIYKSKDKWIKSFLTSKVWVIHSVKRLSDGEVFTISDKTNFGLISKIVINNNSLSFYFEQKSCGYNLQTLIKWKPLFTTEDGVDIFEGDYYYYFRFHSWTFDKAIANQKFHSQDKLSSNSLYFSTKEKAEEYILLNKPCLSYGDVQEYLKIKDCNKVLDLAQSKIQQSV